MDIFCEQLVKRKKTVKDVFIIAAMFFTLIVIPIIGVVLSELINGYFLIVALFAMVLDIYFIWYVVTGRNIEFEYIVTNGTVSIDKVMAKRRRKHIIKFDVKNIETMCTIKEKEISIDKYAKVLYAGKTEVGDDEYQALVYSPKYGNSLLIFSPDEKTLKAMKPYLKAQISVNLFRKK